MIQITALADSFHDTNILFEKFYFTDKLITNYTTTIWLRQIVEFFDSIWISSSFWMATRKRHVFRSLLMSYPNPTRQRQCHRQSDSHHLEIAADVSARNAHFKGGIRLWHRKGSYVPLYNYLKQTLFTICQPYFRIRVIN